MGPWDLTTVTWQNEAAWAVIPARGGSKGLLRKGLCTVAQTPLIGRSVTAAGYADSVQRVFVNTDDPEYMTVAMQYGAEVPFLRPSHLAEDQSSTIDVLSHFFKYCLETTAPLPEFFVLLQPTTPFVNARDVDQAFALLTDGVDAVCSVCESEVNPDWMRRCDQDGYLQPVMRLDVPKHTPRQDMPTTLRLNGGIYWIRTKVFLEQCSMLPSRTVPYLMPIERSVDIDTESDLRYANWLADNQQFSE